MMQTFFDLIEQKQQLQAEYDALHTEYIEEMQAQTLTLLKQHASELRAVQKKIETIRKMQDRATLKVWRDVYRKERCTC